MTQQFIANPENKCLPSFDNAQEKAITQIKHIGEEIFDPQFEDQFFKDFHLPIDPFVQENLVKEERKYSLTERKEKSDAFEAVQEDDWISAYQNQANKHEYTKEPKVKQKKEKNNKFFNKNHNYEKPTKHFTKKTQEYMSEKKNLQKQQVKVKKKNCKELNELYQEKKPLYEKFKEAQAKKEAQMKVSRMIKENEEFDGLTLKPEINHNYDLPTFTERQIISKKNASLNQAKILYDYMKPLTFHPRINSKSGKVESKVKKIWSQQKSQNQAVELKGISESMIKTGSFFSDENSIHFNKNKSVLDVPLKSIDELNYVFEIEDMMK